jgi:superfamily I DNA and/or RNA helicase/very-short-patch-repair endonuclease
MQETFASSVSNNAQDIKVLRRVEDWKSRLIDLSKKNKLLYFRRSKRGNLSITSPDGESIFKKLVLRQKHLVFWLPPEEPKLSQWIGTAVSPPVIHPPADQLVSEGVDRNDLERILKNLYRRSLSDYRERGVRILHAGFGMLVWDDAITKEEVRSPLVLVPLEISRENIRKPFSISVPEVEEEAILNPALDIALKKDFKINLPSLPDDWEIGSLDQYFHDVSLKVAELGWRVEKTLEIGLFDFQKLVIYKDLEANSHLAVRHPIVRAIAGVKDAKLLIEGLPGERDVDTIEAPETTYRIRDADSSQRVAIDYAFRGQSFVMEGPPGTGKSQTIANIIAEGIAKGKTVLFVSDKMAALDVVYKRLKDAGLDHFCLELHSSKANKQEVAAELKRCLYEQLSPRRLPSAHDFERMKQLRDRLNEYVVALHTRQPFLQKSAYEILGELAALQSALFFEVGLRNVGSLTPQQMQDLETLIVNLTNVWQVISEPSFPWVGYKGNEYNLDVRSKLVNQLDNSLSCLDSLKLEAAEYANQLGLEGPKTLDRMKWLFDVGMLLFESPKPEASWMTHADVNQLISDAGIHNEIAQWYKETKQRLLQRYNASFLSDIRGSSAQFEQALSEFGNLIRPSSIREGHFLKLRSPLLEFVRGTLAHIVQWNEESLALASLLQLPIERLTIERLKELVQIASLCFAVEKPERVWCNSEQLEQTKTITGKAKGAYGEYNSLLSEIRQKYTEQIFGIELDEYIRKYSGPYRGFLRWFRPAYHRDQKRLALLTLTGKVPKTILEDLLDVRRALALKEEIDSTTASVQNALGHFYNGLNTNFQRVESAINVVSEVFKLSKTSAIPEPLIESISYLGKPSLEIKKLGDHLGEIEGKWEKAANKLGTVLPESLSNSDLPILQTPLTQVKEWAGDVENRLVPLMQLTAGILENAIQEQPQNYAALLEDLRNAENLRKREEELLSEEVVLKSKFGWRFSGFDTNWKEVVLVLEWAKKARSLFVPYAVPETFAYLASQGPEHAPSFSRVSEIYKAAPKVLAEIELLFEPKMLFGEERIQALDIENLYNRVRELRERVDDLQLFVDFKGIKRRFSFVGLEKFLGNLIEKRPPRDDLLKIFRRGVYQEWINDLYRKDPRLGNFRRENHQQLIDDFRKLDEELRDWTPSMVINEANTRKPATILIDTPDSEAGVLNKEAAKKRRLMPVRSLFQRIPNLLPRLKPCLLMSPITVSQFLDPDMKFDLVLFDEASQIVPEDAIASIYRGKTIVVAGDRNQLPPTSFFQKSSIDDEAEWDESSEAEDTESLESILDEFSAIGLPPRTLRWHYRSKHEDLIAFSNKSFYDGKLVTFPSAQAFADSLGVKLHYVPDGIYDRGGRRDNVAEAKAIADLVFDHIRLSPKKTLGVVTFSVAQRDAIDDEIERRRYENPEYEGFFAEDRNEGFFVKNLENVQGDERDVMIFSVGYGKDESGTMTMNFGPLNKSGGERRLNVAITRAREKAVLVASIKATDIDVRAETPRGVVALRSYLEYAEKGSASTEKLAPGSGEFHSSIEEDVAEEIRKMGYEVELQVGASEYTIDIAVVDPQDPGSFLLGVECDGPTYKSSNSARDRDRLREQVLRQLGWHMYRIWSPSWIGRKQSEVRKLKDELQKASESKSKPARQIAEETSKEKSSVAETEVQKVKFSGIEKIGIPYRVHVLRPNISPTVTVRIRRAPYRKRIKNEFYFPHNRELQCRLLEELVAEEGPIHTDYALERLIKAWGTKRTGPRIVSAYHEAVDQLRWRHRIVEKGDFLWPPSLVDVPVRVPVADSPQSQRPPEQIPPEEIEKAIKIITQYAMGISPDSLISQTMKVFGFNHQGEIAKEPFSRVYGKMVREGTLEIKNGNVCLP